MRPTCNRVFQRKTLIHLRKVRGLTQEELGVKINASRVSVSDWERGRCTPETNWLPGLAEVLGCKIDDLFEPVGTSTHAVARAGES